MFSDLAERLDRARITPLLSKFRATANSYPVRALDLELFDIFDGRPTRQEPDDYGGAVWVADRPLPYIYDEDGSKFFYESLIRYGENAEEPKEIRVRKTDEVPWYTSKVDDALSLAMMIVERDQYWRIEEQPATDHCPCLWTATLLNRDGSDDYASAARYPAMAIVMTSLAKIDRSI